MDQEEPIPLSPEPHLSAERENEDQEEPIPLSLQASSMKTMGSGMREIRNRLNSVGCTGEFPCTPKRKFSPTPISPMGKMRKRTTSISNSPQLRSAWETYEQENQMAPDLIKGIGKLTIKESNVDRRVKQDNLGSAERVPSEDVIDTTIRRERAISFSQLATPKRRGRGRGKKTRNISVSFPTTTVASPSRQLRITDIFQAQQGGTDDAKDLYEAKNV